jgi:hypothetical protein
MNDTPPGRAIGQDTYDAQKAAGDAFVAAHPDLASLPASDRNALIAAFSLQMAQIAGNATITHAIECETVSSDPSTGGGLDRPWQPAPAFAVQVSAGAFVALWMKFGPNATDWMGVGGGGGGGTVDAVARAAASAAQATANAAAPKSTQVNGHALTGNITLTASDVGAMASGAAPTAHAASHVSGADQIADATPSVHGLESAADKTKLDGIAAGATVGADWTTNVANKPTLGTAAAKDVPATGNATNTQVMLGSDTRNHDKRDPNAHAATHASAGTDPITIAESQVTNLGTDLGNLSTSIGTAQSTANGAVTAAASAQSTADNAHGDAATAQATADSATTTATYQMSTGPEWGLTLQSHAGDTSKYDITAGAANFIDRYTTPGTVTRTRVNLPSGIYGITPTWGSGGRHPVYISLDSTGAVVQSSTAPTLDDYTRYSYLGILAIIPGTTTVAAAYPYASYGGDIVARFIQLCLCLKAFNVSGNVYYPSALASPTLNIRRSAGQIFRIGSNTATDLRSLDAPLTNAADPEAFFRVKHVSGAWYYDATVFNGLDPENYDNLTDLVAMTSGHFQIKPVFYSPTTVFIQYGQVQYASMADAVAHLNDTFQMHPAVSTGDFVFRGWWITQQGCTDLNDTSKAMFYERNGIAGSSGSGGGGGGEANTLVSGGTAGIDIPLTKTGTVLRTKSIEGDGSTISVVDDVPNNAIKISALGGASFDPAKVSYYALLRG